MSTLAEKYPIEQARCRELLRQYQEIGPMGRFGYAMIEAVLKRADEAVMSGDIVAMLHSYTEMQGCE